MKQSPSPTKTILIKVIEGALLIGCIFLGFIITNPETRSPLQIAWNNYRQSEIEKANRIYFHMGVWTKRIFDKNYDPKRN